MKTLQVLVLVLVMYSCGQRPVLKEGVENTVKVNEPFRIILQEDHAKGHTWVLDPNFDTGVCRHENTVWHGPDKGVFFEFKALKPGEITLKFTLRMYRDSLDNKIFKLKIHSS